MRNMKKCENSRKNSKLKEKTQNSRKNSKLKVKTQKVGTFRIPGCRKSVQKKPGLHRVKAHEIKSQKMASEKLFAFYFESTLAFRKIRTSSQLWTFVVM